MKHIISTILPLMAIVSPVCVYGQDTRVAEPIAAKIKTLEKKIALNSKIIALHEKCLKCETCDCTIIKKKGAKHHRHIAKAKIGGRERTAKYTATGLEQPNMARYSWMLSPTARCGGGGGFSGTYMDTQIGIAMAPLNEENKDNQEQIERLERKLDTMGFSPESHPTLYSKTRKSTTKGDKAGN